MPVEIGAAGHARAEVPSGAVRTSHMRQHANGNLPFERTMQASGHAPFHTTINAQNDTVHMSAGATRGGPVIVPGKVFKAGAPRDVFASVGETPVRQAITECCSSDADFSPNTWALISPGGVTYECTSSELAQFLTRYDQSCEDLSEVADLVKNIDSNTGGRVNRSRLSSFFRRMYASRVKEDRADAATDIQDALKESALLLQQNEQHPEEGSHVQYKKTGVHDANKFVGVPSTETLVEIYEACPKDLGIWS